VPITRVTSIESGAVVITGLLNMRRFDTRTGELLVLGDLLDRTVTVIEDNEPLTMSMPSESSINFDLLSYSESDSIFNLTADSEVISTNKCSTSAHCDTCTCYQEKVKLD
jgi:hypothetical protein